jgi:polyisoprenoid-binding protein YceI
MTDVNAATGQPRLWRILKSPRWLVGLFLVLPLVAVGIYLWVSVHSALSTSTKFQTVSYDVPTAPRLAALGGETVYRIDPTRSQVTYSVAEKIVGQTAHHATGSTNGIAGDLAVNRTNPAASRVGEIVVDVEQLHSNNNLRDARIRQSFLESHNNPLAEFTTLSLSRLPQSIIDGRQYSFTMTGVLTAHGKPTPVTWNVNAELSGGQLNATATTHVKMSTFGVGPISLAGLLSTGNDVGLTLKLAAVDPSRFSVPTLIAAPASAPHIGHSPSFKNDIEPVLAANCASCHNSGQVGAAHWVLDNAGDAQKVADGIGVVTKNRYMPPWPASSLGVPLAHSKQLDQRTIDTITRWADAGGKLDVPASTPIKPPKSPQGPRPRADVVMKMPQPYTGSLSVPNDYRCFVLDPHFTQPTSVSGYTVTPQHREEIHHSQIFHIDATQAAEGVAMSGNDGQPGWRCYAGPSLPDRGAGRHRGTAIQPNAASATRGSFGAQPGLIAGWVPGQDPTVYPDHSGILFQPGDAIVFQIHYHYDRQPVPDQSSVSFQTDPITAGIQQLDIVNPLAPVEIPCMPGVTAPLCDRGAALASDSQLYGPIGQLAEGGLLLICNKTPEQLTMNFQGVASSSCDTTVPVSGQIVAAMGHMHTLGKSFRLTLDPGTPNEKILLDIPNWNFDWQMNYELATPLHVNAGQTVRMQCSWDRSLDPNRPPKYIVFAEGTEDEMCFSTYAMIPDSKG